MDTHFAHGHTTNGFGGQSKASTQLLDGMHYRGLLRVARRDNGIRLYAAHQPQTAPDDVPATLDRLVDVLVNKYAPLPLPGLRQLVAMLKHAVPQWQGQLRAALQRATQRLPNAELDGVRWFWPEGEDPAARRWLQATLAAAYGIAANLEFPTPGEFVARALQANVPGERDDLWPCACGKLALLGN